MADLNDTFSQIAGVFAQLGIWGIYLGIFILVLGVVAYWFYNKRKWNLKVEFKFPRSDGAFLFSEHGKGNFSASRGNCIIKRPGMFGATHKIKTFDPKVHIQGTDTLTVIQTAPLTFSPVAPESYFEVKDEAGNVANVMTLKGDISKDFQWASQSYKDHMNAYTIKNALRDNAQWFGIGFVILIVLISQYIGIGMIMDRLNGA